MRPKQVAVLALALVALIGVVTYFKMNLPTNARGNPGRATPDDQPQALNFPEVTWPTVTTDPTKMQASAPPPEFEWHQLGHHDFWFQNDTDKAVQMGLVRTTCKCTSVMIALAPEGWEKEKGRKAGAAEAAAVIGSGGLLGALGQAAAGDSRESDPAPDLNWQTLVSETVKNDAGGVVVPPKGRGWVRVGWKSEKLGPERLSLDLWTDPPGPQPIHLEVGVFLVEPVYVEPKEATIDEPINVGDPPRMMSFFCWSPTRDHFRVEPEPADVQKQKHPFITVGSPVPATDVERKALADALKRKWGVRAAYRVPVTVRERLPDGRQSDLGPFHKSFTLTTDTADEPLVVTVLGTVKGDVTVISDSDLPDRIRLVPFPTHFGVSKTVAVEADPGAKLEVVRHPEFMQVELKEEPMAAADRKTWTLTVTILPDQVHGKFPRPDDPSLQDTSVYLETQSKPPRRIRIPVSGEATQR
jgi:hypothetical protein